MPPPPRRAAGDTPRKRTPRAKPAVTAEPKQSLEKTPGVEQDPQHVVIRFGDVVQRESARPADPLDEQHVEDAKSDRELKRSYAKVFLWAMLAQVLAADVIFVFYAWQGKHWNVDPKVMIAWLSATVVQVVGVVAIITQGLFPRAPRPSRRRPPKDG